MNPQEFIKQLSEIKPLVALSEDDSILVEWITDGWRLGISLEPNDDPFWILVSKPGTMETGKAKVE